MATTEHPPLRQRTRRIDPYLDHELERRPQTLRLAQDRRRDPPQPRKLLPTNLGLRTLARTNIELASAINASLCSLHGGTSFPRGPPSWVCSRRSGVTAARSKLRSAT